jgi:DNA-binding NarL/FixJ family response regulator
MKMVGGPIIVPSKTILVVDDDLLFLKTITYALKNTGYNVVTAETAERAYTSLSSSSVDLLLQDLSLPDGNGMEIIKRAGALHRYIKVIVITGYADLKTAVEGLRIGIYDYIEKPIETDILLYRIKRALEAQEMEQQNTELQNHLLQKNEELHRLNTELREEIEKRKASEGKLHRLQEHLEHIVQKRTEELEEVNTALKVLLEQRNKDKDALAESVLSNVRNRLLPHIKRLEVTDLSEKQRVTIEAIRTQLEELIDSFIFKLSSAYLDLTPTELRVAAEIREGLTSKEIAVRNNLSVRTVEVHRENIRKKLKIKHKKINLRSYLLSLD